MTQISFRISPWLLLAVALCAVGQAVAQGKRAGGQCARDRDAMYQQELRLCAEHPACVMVLQRFTECARAQQFFARLKDSLARSQNGPSAARELRPGDLWYAVQDDNSRRVEAPPHWREVSDRLAAAVDAADREVLQSTAQGGAARVYIGDVKDGQPNGIGTQFLGNGVIKRGTFRDGTLDGLGDMLVIRGDGVVVRSIGDYRRDSREGRGIQALERTAFEGTFAQGAPTDGTFTDSKGKKFVGTFHPNGHRIAGSLYDTSGVLLERGTYAGNVLNVGQTFLASGEVDEEVDRPQAAQAQRDQAFNTSLNKLGAAQLHALGLQAQADRDPARSSAVWRALQRRFPNHPLGQDAAQRLQAADRPPAPMAAAPVAPPPPAARAVPARRAAPASCSELTDGFVYAAGAPDAYGRMRADLAAGRITPATEAAQRLWFAERVGRVAESTSLCPANQHALQRANLEQLRAGCKCTTGTNLYFDERRVQAALDAALGGGGPDLSTTASEACRRAADSNPRYTQDMARLRAGNPETTLLLRGAIVGIDLQLRAWQPCAGDAHGQGIIADLQRQRASALRACQQISSSNNCEVSPF